MEGFFPRETSSDGKLLLVSCSSRKRRIRWPIPARNLYTGTLLQLALQFAETHGFRPLILSAKYGVISPEEEIPYYDQKLSKPYSGPWPDGEGYYIGSQLYFGLAPSRFQRLIPGGLPIGKQLAYLKRLIREGPPE